MSVLRFVPGSVCLVSPGGQRGKISRSACSTLGRRGFDATTKKHFLGVEQWHKNWLSVAGRSCDLIHPSKLSSGAFHLLFYFRRSTDTFSRWVPYLIDSDLHCLEAMLFRVVRGRSFWRFF